jgi:hypothetical protein
MTPTVAAQTSPPQPAAGKGTLVQAGFTAGVIFAAGVILACALDAAPSNPTTPHNINPRRNPREQMQARMIFSILLKNFPAARAEQGRVVWESSCDRSGHPRTRGGSNLAAESAGCK